MSLAKESFIIKYRGTIITFYPHLGQFLATGCKSEKYEDVTKFIDNKDVRLTTKIKTIEYFVIPEYYQLDTLREIEPLKITSIASVRKYGINEKVYYRVTNTKKQTRKEDDLCWAFLHTPENIKKYEELIKIKFEAEELEKRYNEIRDNMVELDDEKVLELSGITLEE